MVGRHRLLVVALIVTAGYTGLLQVQVNYARNEAVETARELAAPVNDLCRDATTAQQLGRATCEWAARVTASNDADAATSDLVGRMVLALLRAPR